MDITAVEAKERLAQMFEDAQREPVIIEKSGARHSVVISAARYEELLAAERRVVPDSPRAPTAERKPRNADEFYEMYKDWVDEQNDRLRKYGLWNEEFRTW